MRHILIENIDKNEVYVPNDISLGCEDKIRNVTVWNKRSW